MGEGAVNMGSNIDSMVNHLSGEYPPASFLNPYLIESPLESPTTLDPQSTTNMQRQYLIDPNSEFPGTFGEGFNLGYVTPTQLGHSIIDPVNPGNPPPPPYSASADGTMLFLGAGEPYGWPTAQTSMQVVAPMNQNNVETNAVREAAKSRRKTSASFYCELCGADFTAAHNLQYHRNKHDDRRPYPCAHRHRGCDYSAAAPSTAARHSGTCRYRLS